MANLFSKIESLYRRYGKWYDKETLEWFAEVLSDLTEAEIESAFRRGPQIWTKMPTPAEFRDVVKVDSKPGECANPKCCNGMVPVDGETNTWKKCETCRSRKEKDNG